MAFVKAKKSQGKLRMALVGPAGSGKTFTALTLASSLGERIAVIDTEHGSASKYADKFSFDVCELSNFNPKNYIEAIRDAEAAGYQVIVIDSLSHAWNGTGGVLEIVEAAGARARGNSYAGWREGTPAQNAMIEAMVQSKCHIIATMRSKTEYVLEKDERTGKTAPRKVGMAAVQRDGAEYEFDVVGDMDVENTLSISKTRCDKLSGALIKKPGKQLADTLNAWLSDGEPQESPPARSVAPVLVGSGESPAGDESGVVVQDAVQDKEETDLKLSLILSCIDGAKSVSELEGLLPRIKELPEGDKRLVRAAYGNKRKLVAVTLPQIAEAAAILSTP